MKKKIKIYNNNIPKGGDILEAKKLEEKSVVNKLKEVVNTAQYNFHPVRFRGEIKSCEIVEVPIDEIYYRVNNHRFQCAIKEYVAKSKGKYDDSTLKKDIRRPEVQEMIEKVLMTALGDDSLDLENKLIKEKQTTPLCLTIGNVVVNGNSRLYLMKKLYNSDPERFKHFAKIRCVYLPEDATEVEINQYERQEQMEKDVTVEYLWFEKANWYYQYKKEENATDEEVAKEFETPKQEVVKALAAFEEGLLYLEAIEKPHHYKLIEHEKSALESLAEVKKKLAKEPAKQKLAEQICYWYLGLDIDERPERLFMYFKRIGSFLDKIEEGLLEFGPVADNLTHILEGEEEPDEIDVLLNGEEDVSDTEKILKTIKAFDPTKKRQTRIVIDKIVDYEKMKIKDKEQKLIPEMELKQAIEHIQTSFAHYSKESPGNIHQYLKQASKLISEYSKRVSG